MSIKNKKTCPEVQLIEAYISNQISFASDRKNISHHIYSCPRCHALAAEFYQYYQILEQELNKPVANSTFKLVNNIEQDRVVIAGILLQPGDQQGNERSLNYQAEILIINQNKENSEIDDFDCIPIDDKEVFIRAVQSSQKSETTLFLFANDKKLYRNVRLQILPNEETFLSDEIGIIRLGHFELKNLDERQIIITPEN